MVARLAKRLPGRGAEPQRENGAPAAPFRAKFVPAVI